jgi:hypothetical protein
LPRAEGLAAFGQRRAWALSSHGARCDRASDTPVASPSSPLTVAHLRGLSRSPSFRSRARVGLVRESPRPRPRRLVKDAASNGPGYLPSVGTLRRIRWPLQPRFRDRRTLFWRIRRPPDDALTPPWVSADPRPFLSGESDPQSSLHSTHSPTLSRRRSLRARSPFTRPCRPFWERVCRAYLEPDAAYRFLQLHFDVRATKPELTILAGRETSISILFFSRHAFSLAEAVTCGEPRSVRSRTPRCRFLPLAQVCPTAMLPRTRHLRRLAPSKFSAD